jgi:hypothetical protein
MQDKHPHKSKMSAESKVMQQTPPCQKGVIKGSREHGRAESRFCCKACSLPEQMDMAGMPVSVLQCCCSYIVERGGIEVLSVHARPFPPEELTILVVKVS